MKKEEKLQIMDLADTKYIEEAAPGDPSYKKSPSFKKTLAVIAACFMVLITTLSLWLFIPFNTDPPDVSKYSDSEYYDIICKLNVFSYKKPEFKNNFEKIKRMLSGVGELLIFNGNKVSSDLATGDHYPNAESAGVYEEITDNQVQGVTEADIIKRSDKYIYYFYPPEQKISIYSIEGPDSSLVNTYTLTLPSESRLDYPRAEMYLSKECDFLTLILPIYNLSSGSSIYILSLEIKDGYRLEKYNDLLISGALNTSRSVNGEILLLTEFVADKPDFDSPETFLPTINGQTIEGNKIFYPDQITNNRYTVILRIREKGLDLIDNAAFLSYSDNVYISADNIFVTREYYQTLNTRYTEITALSYKGNTFEYLGAITLNGYIKDQYSLDQYNGYLRVATTTDGSEGSNASLYCIDLNDWSIKGKVTDFAPWGETVRSVRFDQDHAYICTAIEKKDPVFFFDISDPENITYTQTGTIEGFSTSLIQLGHGYLLGIGSGGNDTIKIEIYEESLDWVVSVCKFEIEGEYSLNYKSYYIDREHSLFGFGYHDYNHDYRDGQYKYVLLYFTGYDLIPIAQSQKLYTDPLYMRGVYIDGFFYMIGTDIDIADLQASL